MPGKSGSSGMNRMSCVSGLPQPASVTVAPAAAEALMKSRRSIEVFPIRVYLIMTGYAVVRSFLLPMTADTETHRVFNGARRHRHLTDIPMTGRAVDSSANVRSVIESYV